MENQTFAGYILSEKDWIKKMEIMYYLNKRGNVYFDNSVVFKTDLLNSRTEFWWKYANNGLLIVQL